MPGKEGKSTEEIAEGLSCLQVISLFKTSVVLLKSSVQIRKQN